MAFDGKQPPRGSVRPNAGEAFEYPQPRLPGDLDSFDESDPIEAGREEGTDAGAPAAVQPRRNNVIPFRPRQSGKGN